MKHTPAGQNPGKVSSHPLYPNYALSFDDGTHSNNKPRKHKPPSKTIPAQSSNAIKSRHRAGSASSDEVPLANLPRPGQVAAATVHPPDHVQPENGHTSAQPDVTRVEKPRTVDSSSEDEASHHRSLNMFPADDSHFYSQLRSPGRTRY